MADWKFDPPSLLHKGGAGFRVTHTTTPQEISEAVKNILRGTTFTPDEAAFELVAQASTNIDWSAMLNPYVTITAPLLNAVPGSSTQKVIPIEQLDKIYSNLETAYYAIKEFDPRVKPPT